MSDTATPEQKAAALDSLRTQAEARRAELLERVSETDNGGVILNLHRPVEVAGTKHPKLTMTKVTVGVVRRTPVSENGTYNALDIAVGLVTTPGAVDAIDNEDDMDLVIHAALAQQGNFQSASSKSGGA